MLKSLKTVVVVEIVEKETEAEIETVEKEIVEATETVEKDVLPLEVILETEATDEMMMLQDQDVLVILNRKKALNVRKVMQDQATQIYQDLGVQGAN